MVRSKTPAGVDATFEDVGHQLLDVGARVRAAGQGDVAGEEAAESDG
jgi:hypothetical protein